MRFYFANFSFEIEILGKKEGSAACLVNVFQGEGEVLVNFSLQGLILGKHRKGSGVLFANRENRFTNGSEEFAIVIYKLEQYKGVKMQTCDCKYKVIWKCTLKAYRRDSVSNANCKYKSVLKCEFY